jgi:hypothetical protein
MAPKPKRSWFDVQMVLMTISMVSVLGLWNLFAGPDREAALRKAAEAQANQPEPVEPPSNLDSPVIASADPPSEAPALSSAIPLPEPGEKIMLGGAAPQTQVIIQAKRKNNGGAVTSTSSS